MLNWVKIMLKKVLTICISCMASNILANETITVFQFNGSLQCHESIVVSPGESAKKLSAAGLKVISETSDKIPYGIPKKCGAPTGDVNLLVVDKTEWTKFAKQQPGTLGFGVWIFERPTLEVFKYDGTLQCGQGNEIPLDTMAKELTDKGIEVISSRKGKDGLVHIALCGTSTGSLNVYTLNADSLAQAKELGFKGLITQSMSSEIIPPSTARRGSVQTRGIPQGLTPQQTQVPRIW